MMVRSLFALVLLAAAALAFGQTNTAPEVKLILPKTAKAGTTIKATIQVTFAEGLHGYQNPPSEDYQIPVKVSIATKGVTLAKIHYPKGVLMAMGGDPKPCAVYDGVVKIPVEIKLPKKPGALALKFVLSYQQCNDQSCYPPAKVEASAKLALKK